MSMRNYDRHGMANLAHEETKPLDRLKIPPWLIYGVLLGMFLGGYYQFTSDKGMNI